MKKTLLFGGRIVMCCMLLALPVLTFAQVADSGVSTNAQETIFLVNPLGETDPRVLLGRLIAGLLSLIGSITVLMFVYAGLLWITAQGDDKKVARGKNIMVWATLGLGVIAAAYVAVNAIISALTTGSAT